MVNFLAVLVAGVASMIFGSVWYGPLFGRTWIKLMGLSGRQVKAMKKQGLAKSYGLMFIASLVMAFVIAQFLKLTSSTSFASAILMAFWLWLGFIATILLGGVLWENKSAGLYLFNVVYWLINVWIMASILVVWV